jgi:hypothetical protein
MRQGNLNAEVTISRYVTQASFDTFSWQTVERKAKFIGQIMRGSLDVREIEDISATAMSYGEVKALASGNPLLLEKAQADAEVTRLERLERSHFRNQSSLKSTVLFATQELETIASQTRALAEVLPRILATKGDAFAMQVRDHSYSKRSEAAEALAAALQATRHTARPGEARKIGVMAGLTLTAAHFYAPEAHAVLQLQGLPAGEIQVTGADINSARPLGVLTRLENKAAGVNEEINRLHIQADRAATERGRAQTDVGAAFPHAEALATGRATKRRIDQALTAEHNPSGAEEPPAAADHAASITARTPSLDHERPPPAPRRQGQANRNNPSPAYQPADATPHMGM